MIGSPNPRVSNICFYSISITFFHKVAHTFIVVCDGGGQFSSRPFNKWFYSFWNGWSIDNNILCSSIIILFKSSKYLALSLDPKISNICHDFLKLKLHCVTINKFVEVHFIMLSFDKHFNVEIIYYLFALSSKILNEL